MYTEEIPMEKGYRRVSLGVNKENYAVRMYQNLGFEIVGEGADETEWSMMYQF